MMTICKRVFMLQFLASNAINTPTITSNKHALYGVNGGNTASVALHLIIVSYNVVVTLRK